MFNTTNANFFLSAMQWLRYHLIWPDFWVSDAIIDVTLIQVKCIVWFRTIADSMFFFSFSTIATENAHAFIYIALWRFFCLGWMVSFLCVCVYWIRRFIFDDTHFDISYFHFGPSFRPKVQMMCCDVIRIQWFSKWYFQKARLSHRNYKIYLNLRSLVIWSQSCWKFEACRAICISNDWHFVSNESNQTFLWFAMNSFFYWVESCQLQLRVIIWL